MTDQMVQGSVPAVQNQGKEVPVVNQIKSMLSTDNVQKRFGGSPGKKAPQFMASITNTVAASKQLKPVSGNIYHRGSICGGNIRSSD